MEEEEEQEQEEEEEEGAKAPGHCTWSSMMAATMRSASKREHFHLERQDKAPAHRHRLLSNRCR